MENHFHWLVYHDVKLEVAYRLDLLAENALVVEIKAIDALADFIQPRY
jgi:hypothetical protein